ncbi:MAG TPA: 7-cyano-7-deazaguanine synthase [Bdellovibrionota bacterium]|jgi:7-cyano-7-deazaguanine synthase
MAVILLSGGLDSALNLALAAKQKRANLALTIRYGQRAEGAEASAAEALAAYYRVPWKQVDLRWLGEVNPTALTKAGLELPRLSTAELDSSVHNNASMRAVWVANRNGVFLNVAAAFAEALGDDEVLAGYNAEEAATFPDNSAAFLDSATKAFSYSTLNKVRASSYTTAWDKTRILQEALAIELPLDKVWSCYEPGPARCWTCESCKRSERALLAAGEAGRPWLARMGWKK